MRILFVSYDGLLEPLGRSQVIPYFRALARRGHVVELLTFEKPQDLRRGGAPELRRELAADGIAWMQYRYHKSPSVPATAWDLAVGCVSTCLRARAGRFDFVHGRSYVGGLMALAAKRMTGTPFVFEMRGFWVDERVDGGLWSPRSWLVRTAARAERALFRGADAVLVSSRAGIRRIQATPERFPVQGELVLARTAVDLVAFAPRARDAGSSRDASSEWLARKAGLAGRFVLVYSGSLGTWYLLDPMIRFFKALRTLRRDARLLVLTRGPEGPIHAAANTRGVAPHDVVVRAVKHEEIPRWLSLADAGIVFVAPLPSKAASSAIKLSEFLAMGLPVVLNAGVGDTGELVAEAGAGVVLADLDDASLLEGARRLLESDLPTMGRTARRLAEQVFALEAAVDAYERTYERLAERRNRSSRHP
ncbi:MAG: glycosyltransferase family 4 protein [Gemmatimonadetes bacterium]|nr:glycosyltransferase family 4 protein [Gemmatimonadota bacterium]